MCVSCIYAAPSSYLWQHYRECWRNPSVTSVQRWTYSSAGHQTSINFRWQILHADEKRASKTFASFMSENRDWLQVRKIALMLFLCIDSHCMKWVKEHAQTQQNTTCKTDIWAQWKHSKQVVSGFEDRFIVDQYTEHIKTPVSSRLNYLSKQSLLIFTDIKLVKRKGARMWAETYAKICWMRCLFTCIIGDYRDSGMIKVTTPVFKDSACRLHSQLLFQHPSIQCPLSPRIFLKIIRYITPSLLWMYIRAFFNQSRSAGEPRFSCTLKNGRFSQYVVGIQ